VASGLAVRLAVATDFRPLRFVSLFGCVLVTQRVKRASASIAAGTLKSIDGGDQMAGDEHQLEIKGPGHVLNRGEPRIDRRALEVGDLALPQA
jgi:hypothetical protein